MEQERPFLVSPSEVLSLVKVSLEANLMEEEEPQWKIKGAGFENDYGIVDDPWWCPCRVLFRRRSDDHWGNFRMTRRINLRQGNWDERRSFLGLRGQGL